MNSYNNAEDAFESYYYKIMGGGEDVGNGTKAMYNVSFEILDPLARTITTEWRNFKKEYAEHEFDWYESGDRTFHLIGDAAKIWCLMGDPINSNYGYQIRRNEQFGKVVNLLAEDPHTRRAVITVYDGKEIDNYKDDTPCLLSLTFSIDKCNKLHMSVHFRSQDLVYGFCNDNYTLVEYFVRVYRLLKYKRYPELKMGRTHWFINNLHIYEKHWDMRTKTIK